MPKRLTLTTDHAASSYGQPVAVDPETRIAYGPGDLFTTEQTATTLGVDGSHVRRMAIKHDIGSLLSPRVRVFTLVDVGTLRSLLVPGMGRPKGKT